MRNIRYIGISTTTLMGNGSTYQLHSTQFKDKMGVWINLPKEGTIAVAYRFTKLPVMMTKPKALEYLLSDMSPVILTGDQRVFVQEKLATYAPKSRKVKKAKPVVETQPEPEATNQLHDQVHAS